MKKQFSQQELKLKAAAYCSMSEHCTFEVKKKLTEWGAKESEIEQIIDYLLKENFLDEQRYAQAFVKDKFRFSKWGKIKLSFELRIKHIPENKITQAITQIDDDDYYNTLFELLKKKDKTIKYSSQNDRKAKLLRFAQSRGFEIDLTLKTIDRII